MMLPRSILRLIAGLVGFALACIGMVLQNAVLFATESAVHVAQVHGSLTPEMRDHLIAQSCFAFVCFCAGALGGGFALWVICLPIRLALFLVHLALTFVFQTMCFWCQPLQPLVRCVQYCATRVVRALP